MLLLSEREREILAATYFQADRSVKSIAQELGLQEFKVRHSLQQLVQKERIRIRPYFNPFALGLREYGAWITLRSPGGANRVRLCEAFRSLERTTYVTEVEGPYQLFVMLLAQDVSDLESCFDMLSRTIPEISFKKSVCEIMKVTLFTPKRLSERTLQVNSLSYFPLSTVAPIDFTDHRILCSLGQNANPSTAVIARQLGLPVSTVTYRIKAMRDSGVILALGYSASVFDDGRIPFGLLISVVRTSPAFRTTFWDFCCAHPAVSALLTVSGPWEHQVEVEVRDARAVSAVVQEFYEAFPQNIDEIVTIPIGSMHKLTPYPFSADSSIVRSRTVARTDSL